MAYTTNKVIIDAVTTTTTSAGIVVGDRQKIGIHFKLVSATASGTISGTGHAQVQISNDGSNWITYKRLISNNTAGTMISQVNLNNTHQNDYAFVTVGDCFESMRVVFNHDNTNGVFSAIVENMTP